MPSPTDTALTQRTLTGADSRLPRHYTLDGRAWAIWLVATAVVALLVRNPWYQLLLGGWIILSWPAQTQQTRPLFGLKDIAWFGALALVFSAVFNALTVHIGATVLFTMPGRIPLFSGPITLEAAAFGLSNGLTITLMVLVFARFSRAMDYTTVLRYFPAALFEMALILAIAFTLIPNMLHAWKDIQQAQALRGHRLRGIRDLPPLLVPLVVNGLERALALAEAMEARGYARRGAKAASIRARLLLAGSLAGVLLLLLIRTFMDIQREFVLMGLSGCGLCLWLGLRQYTVTRTHFRQGHWSWPESVVVAAALAMLAAFLLVSAYSLNFAPYPRLSLPDFNPWLGLATLGVAVPALLEKHD